jgi:predicted HAD superfamily Cof-like phosphohydrolase
MAPNRTGLKMSKTFTDVSVFLTAVGQQVPVKPIGETDQSKLYKKLIDEEYQEFLEAFYTDDTVEEIDACFDMMWVIIGYMKSRGWDCENIWDEGAKSNLSKIDPVTGLVKRREDGKILKPEGWKTPDFTKFVK